MEGKLVLKGGNDTVNTPSPNEECEPPAAMENGTIRRVTMPI